MGELHPVEYLLARLEEEFVSYPPGVVRVPQLIPGTAFFPGGYGLWGTEAGKPLPPMPRGGVMVLGHNFDSEAGFASSLKHEGENLNGAIWKNLLQLLEGAGILNEECFFTNFYMGLIAGSKAVGRFPGARDANFVQRCREFLGEQLRVMQPKIVLVLGREILKVIAPLSTDLSGWLNVKSWQSVDQQIKAALVYPVMFSEISHSVAVVALVHPSFRPANIARRHYQGFQGDEAELAMLKDALEKIGRLRNDD